MLSFTFPVHDEGSNGLEIPPPKLSFLRHVEVLMPTIVTNPSSEPKSERVVGSGTSMGSAVN